MYARTGSLPFSGRTTRSSAQSSNTAAWFPPMDAKNEIKLFAWSVQQRRGDAWNDRLQAQNIVRWVKEPVSLSLGGSRCSKQNDEEAYRLESMRVAARVKSSSGSTLFLFFVQASKRNIK